MLLINVHKSVVPTTLKKYIHELAVQEDICRQNEVDCECRKNSVSTLFEPSDGTETEARKPKWEHCSKIQLTSMCLIIQLLKFDVSGKKIRSDIQFPVDKLDLSGCSLNDTMLKWLNEHKPLSDPDNLAVIKPGEYTLYAVCIHLGEPTSGHYVLLINCNDVCYRFNDSNVSVIADIIMECSTQEVLQNAYLLRYKRLKKHFV